MNTDPREIVFTDLAQNRRCYLVIPRSGRLHPDRDEPKIGIRHPGCKSLADITVELDAFWCLQCQWNGRVSGNWVIDQVRKTGI